jgi:methionine-rich copper-binding protein CopC
MDTSRRTANRLPRFLYIFAVILTGLVAGAALTPGLAQAHGTLVVSTPATGTSVAAPIPAVSLTFTEKPASFAYFTITAPTGARVDSGWSNAQPSPLATPVREYQQVNGVWQPQLFSTGFPVRVAVAHWPAPGAYTVRYQSVASDGDQVKGEFWFTYTGTPTAAPANWQAPTDQPKAELLAAAHPSAGAPAAGQAQAQASQAKPQDDASMWVWLVPALLVIAAVLCYLLIRPPAFLARRRS